ncbi:MAG: AI-2E family transporter [Planctomycetaceae bacterium]|nr:AI-2E family transporter [Planctomycetaceae bacterium]
MIPASMNHQWRADSEVGAKPHIAAAPHEDSCDASTAGSADAKLPVWLAVCLVIVTFSAISQALYAASSVCIPVASSVVIALALRPLVRRLRSAGIPDMLAAGVVLGLTLFFAAVVLARLVTPASEWLGRTPFEFRMRQLERKLAPVKEPLQSLTEASERINEVASAGATEKDIENHVQQVVVKPPSLISEVVNSTTEFAAGVFLSLVLTYFLLATGDRLIAQIGTLLPPDRKLGTNRGDVIGAVEQSVSTYLMTVGLINLGLGIAVAFSCRLIGLPNPMLWGAVATVLNFLPYLGGLIGAGITLSVSILTFDSLGYSFVAPAIYLLLTAIEGNLITPSILGRSMSLNPLVVILWLTYWSWLWGLPGTILAVPMLAIVVSTCRQFDRTRAFAALLSS